MPVIPFFHSNQGAASPVAAVHDRRSRNQGRRILAVAGMAFALGISVLHADYNPDRIGFCTTYPTTYAGWPRAFLAGDGKVGMMIFGNPLDETVIYNDRGFNLAGGDGPRSFAQVSKADLATIKDDCAKGDFAPADQLAASSARVEKRRRRQPASRLRHVHRHPAGRRGDATIRAPAISARARSR